MDKEDFENQSVWTSIQETLDLLKGITDPSEEESKRIASIRYVASQVRGYERIDARLFHPNMFSTMNTVWEQVLTHTQNFVNARGAGHLTNADSKAQEALIPLASWPKQPNFKGAAATATATFKAYSSALEDAIAELQGTLSATQESAKNQREALQQEIAELKIEVASSKQEIASAVAGVESEREQLRSALTTTTTTFTDSQTKRSSDFDAAQQKRSDRFGDWLTEQEDKFTKLAQPHVDDIQSRLEEAKENHRAIDDLRHSTETLAGLTTGEILSQKYGKHANKEHWFGLGTYALGFVLLVMGAVFIWDAVNGLEPSQGVSWSFTAFKLGISTVIVGGATMAFRLGGRFIENANASKRIELELNAIGPFLSDVEKEHAADEAKLAFVDRTFGRTWETNTNAAPEENQTNGQVATAIADIVASITKRQ